MGNPIGIEKVVLFADFFGIKTCLGCEWGKHILIAEMNDGDLGPDDFPALFTSDEIAKQLCVMNAGMTEKVRKLP